MNAIVTKDYSAELAILHSPRGCPTIVNFSRMLYAKAVWDEDYSVNVTRIYFSQTGPIRDWAFIDVRETLGAIYERIAGISIID